MRLIDKIIASKTPIKQKECLWIDTSKDDPKLKIAKDGEWKTITSDGQTLETIKITYSELKSLRDNSQLIPGQQYRITDYETTVGKAIIENGVLDVKDHRFDIIVTAMDSSHLFEDAKAAYHEQKVKHLRIEGDDRVFKLYDGTFLDYDGSDAGFECWVNTKDDNDFGFIEEGHAEVGKDLIYYLEKISYGKIAEIYESDEIDPHFKNANFSAWKIKYCLDNAPDICGCDWSNYIPDAIKVYNEAFEEYGMFIRYKALDTDKKCWAFLSYPYDDFSEVLYWEALDTDTLIFTDSDHPSHEDIIYSEGSPAAAHIVDTTWERTDLHNGKGVIKYLEDEFGNSAYYDFKNIVHGVYKLYTYSAADTDASSQFYSGMTGLCFDGSVSGTSFVNNKVIDQYNEGVDTPQYQKVYLQLALNGIGVCLGIESSDDWRKTHSVNCTYRNFSGCCFVLNTYSSDFYNIDYYFSDSWFPTLDDDFYNVNNDYDYRIVAFVNDTFKDKHYHGLVQ